jgi:lipoyl-dependent peroxiredoxin
MVVSVSRRALNAIPSDGPARDVRSNNDQRAQPGWRSAVCVRRVLMAVESSANATWDGELVRGRGSVRPASGAFAELPLSWSQRAESRESEKAEFLRVAEAAKVGCPVSRALAGVPITLAEATLV